VEWRVLPLVVDEPAALLQQGAAALDALADDPTPTLRWYRASSPDLVLGRGQAPIVATPALTVVTRSTGGGAVLMDSGLLSLDVLLPSGHPLLQGDVGTVFARVGEAWGQALIDLASPKSPSTVRRPRPGAAAPPASSCWPRSATRHSGAARCCAAAASSWGWRSGGVDRARWCNAGCCGAGSPDRCWPRSEVTPPTPR